MDEAGDARGGAAGGGPMGDDGGNRIGGGTNGQGPKRSLANRVFGTVVLGVLLIVVCVLCYLLVAGFFGLVFLPYELVSVGVPGVLMHGVFSLFFFLPAAYLFASARAGRGLPAVSMDYEPPDSYLKSHPRIAGVGNVAARVCAVCFLLLGLAQGISPALDLITGADTVTATYVRHQDKGYEQDPGAQVSYTDRDGREHDLTWYDGSPSIGLLEQRGIQPGETFTLRIFTSTEVPDAIVDTGAAVGTGAGANTNTSEGTTGTQPEVGENAGATVRALNDMD